MIVPERFRRSADDHKGSSRLVVAAGSRGFAGAGVLAAQAAIRAGCGTVRWVVPESLYPAVAAVFLDGWVTSLPDGDAGHLHAHHAADLLSWQAEALLIGPGLGTGAQQLGLLRALIENPGTPALILDADALTLLGQDPARLAARRGVTVITPHPAEAAHLLDISTGRVQADRPAAARALALASGAVVVLKGRGTLVVAGEDDIWCNTIDSAMLASAGSGDVLAGLLAGLVARGIPPVDAACFAVAWHGSAGRSLETRFGAPQGCGASALLDALLEVQQNGFHEHPADQ